MSALSTDFWLLPSLPAISTALPPREYIPQTARSISEMVWIADNAIGIATSEKARLGAVQHRLSHIASELTNTYDTLSGAEANMMEADTSREMARYSVLTLKQRAAMSLYAQLNNQTASLAKTVTDISRPDSQEDNDSRDSFNSFNNNNNTFAPKWNRQ